MIEIFFKALLPTISAVVTMLILERKCIQNFDKKIKPKMEKIIKGIEEDQHENKKEAEDWLKEYSGKLINGIDDENTKKDVETYLNRIRTNLMEEAIGDKTTPLPDEGQVNKQTSVLKLIRKIIDQLRVDHEVEETNKKIVLNFIDEKLSRDRRS